MSLADSLEARMPELFEATGRSATQKADSAQLNSAPISAEFEESILADLEIPPKASIRITESEEVENEDDDEDELTVEPSTALVKPEHPTTWSSAASARDFLEHLAPQQNPGALGRFWNARRGDVYLGIAVILVACVIRWGILPNHSVGASGQSAAAHSKPAPDSDLSMFDRMLISMGLAEAPPPPSLTVILPRRFGLICRQLFTIVRGQICTGRHRKENLRRSGTRNWTSSSPLIASPATERSYVPSEVHFYRVWFNKA